MCVCVFLKDKYWELWLKLATPGWNSIRPAQWLLSCEFSVRESMWASSQGASVPLKTSYSGHWKASCLNMKRLFHYNVLGVKATVDTEEY